MAGLAYGQYGYLQWIAKQSIPFTSTGEYMESWAALKGIIRKPASTAGGMATFNGVPTTDIPPGTIISRSDGVQYTTMVDGIIAGGGSITVPVMALVAGASGNADVVPSVSLSSPIAGVAAVTVTILTGGADIETDDSLRTRMLLQYRAPPNGGSATDFEEWALQVPGVTRAWSLPNGNGLGTVIVYFMMDIVNAGIDLGFPMGGNGVASLETRATPAPPGDQLNLANHIYPLRPVCSLVYAVAPIPQAIDVTIANLSPSTPDLKEQINNAMIATLTKIGSPLGSIVYMSEITTAIESVPGVQWFTLVTPSNPVAIAVGSLPVLGVVTYS
jgi:uncharacterized phage protein gp47/JayE